MKWKWVKEANDNGKSTPESKNAAMRGMMKSMKPEDMDDDTLTMMKEIMKAKGKMKKNGKIPSTEVPVMTEGDFIGHSEDWQEAHEISFEDISNIVNVAVKEEYDEDDAGNGYVRSNYFIFKLWPDKVVLKKSYENKSVDNPMYVLHAYEIKYDEDDDDKPYAELGDGIAVRQVFVPADMEVDGAVSSMREADCRGIDDPAFLEQLGDTLEQLGDTEDEEGGVGDDDVEEAVIHETKERDFTDHVSFPLSEAKVGKSGDTHVLYGVSILSRKSANNRIYPDEVMEASIPLFEGLKAYLDHPSESEKAEPRRIRDLIGQHLNVRFDKKTGRMKSDLHLIPNKLVEEIVLPIATTKPNLIGNSIAARGKVADDGRVMEITAARSVDLVAEPATTQGLYEAAGRARGEPETNSTDGGDEMTIEDIKKDEKLMAQLREEIVAELRAEGELDGIKEENKSLKEQVVKYEAAEEKRKQDAAIDKMIAESKLPDKTKKDPKVRSLIEATTAEKRLDIIKNLEQVVAEASSGVRPDESLNFERDTGTNGKKPITDQSYTELAESIVVR